MALLGSDYGDEIVGELNVYATADLVLTVSQAEAELIGSLVNGRTLTHSVYLQRAAGGGGSGFRSAVRDALRRKLQSPTERGCRPLRVSGDPPSRSGGAPTRAPALRGGRFSRRDRSRLRGRDSTTSGSWAGFPTLTPYYERARVVLVPLRYGAGTKQKVIQALMANVPLVATSIGAEGLHLEHGRGFPARRRRCILRRGDRAPAPRPRPVGAGCKRDNGRDRAAQRGSGRRGALHGSRRRACA